MSSSQFYDPILDTAGVIAHEYDLSIADVMSLLVKANRDEALVREALDESAKSSEAREARAAGKRFDLVVPARALLEEPINRGK
jgi:hypothetical protein